MNTYAIRNRLLRLIKTKAILKGEFELSSGEISDHYLDLRVITLSAEGLYYVTKLMFDKIVSLNQDVTMIGGPELSAIPIVSSLVQYSYQVRHPIDGFIFRDKPKPYGLMKMIEGLVIEGSNIVIIDDVTTTGASVLRVAEYISQLHCKVPLIMSIVDRGGGNRISNSGYSFHTLFKYEELLLETKAEHYNK